MAKIGDQLSNLETGWRRYDDTDSNIAYENYWLINMSNSNWFNKTGHEGGKKIRFNFTKSKIRLYFIWYSDRSDNIEIDIDGVIYKATSNDGQLYNYSKLTFEKTDLPDKEHCVCINSNGHTIFDAIDIDENGELKPYKKIKRHYLIEQSNDYYYINHNYIKIEQSDVDNQLTNLINKYGYEDISILTKMLDNKKVPVDLEDDNINVS